MLEGFWAWVALITVLGAVIGGMTWLVRDWDKADAKYARKQDNALQRANTICGSPPVSIIQHGSSWNWGPWIEVRCKDGTTRAIHV